ncbi:unnamed protein product [Darwinula stevensoni]|uniref:C-type lectin domain-containing protein n=1 Tax=Darwinula stevensoni TaxID=69355 RepID=A0A7R8X9D2_9CRUS|nr:unnamed protein product [Darwinula stevensoni]CAG0885477.1 unnamed protein product [Darwinula stevensoni]
MTMGSLVQAQMSTLNYQLYKMGMQVVGPIAELQLLTSVECAFHCHMSKNPTCYTFSATKSSGAVDCRLSGWKPNLQADTNSEYFVLKIPGGYELVPGTSSYVKTVVTTTKNWNQAEADCEVDGGRLAVDTNQQIHAYMTQMILSLGIYSNVGAGTGYFRIGGQSTMDANHWRLLDGTLLNYTGKGQGLFHPTEPNQGGGCLMIAVYKAPDSTCCNGRWADNDCTITTWSSGYFCEIQVPA